MSHANRKPQTLVSVALVLLVSALAAQVSAQDPPAEVATPPVTLESAQALYDQAQKSTDFSEIVKGQLVRTLAGALEHLKAAEEYKKQIAAFDAIATDGAAQLEQLQKELDQPPEAKKAEAPTDAALPQLVQLLAQSEGTLATARAEMAALETESAGRDERRKQLPSLLEQARADIAAEPPMEAPVEPWFIPQLAEARALFQEARKVNLQAQIECLEKETDSYDFRGKLLQLQMDRAIRNLDIQEQLVQEWRALVSDQRKKDATKALQYARDAMLDAAEATPELRQLAQQLAGENQAMVDLRTGPDGVMAMIEQAGKDLEELDAQLKQVQENSTGATQKIGVAGVNAGIGLLLRKYKEQLPNPRQLNREISGWQSQISDVQVKRIEYGEQRMALAQLDKAMEPLRKQIPATFSPQNRQKIETLLRTLLQAKRDSLDALLHDYDSYFGMLINLTDRAKVLVQETEKFSNYINEQILWVRSSSPVAWVDFQVVPATLGRLFEPSRWAQVPQVLVTEWRGMFAIDLFILLGLAVLVWLYRRIAGQLAEMSGQSAHPADLSLRPTTNALLGTFLLALPMPALFWLLGWRISTGASASDFVRAFGSALCEGSYLLLAFETARQCLRPQGLFQVHFRWPEAPVKTVRRHLSWFMIFATFSFFVLSFLDGFEGEVGRDPLARFTFLLAAIGALVFSDRLLRPSGPVASIATMPEGSNRRWFFRIGYGVIAAGLMALMLLSSMGYLYTALQLTRRLSQTLILFFVLIVVRGLVMRWLLLARRRLALRQIRIKHEAEKDRQEQKADVAPRELAFDIDRIDQQTTRLINSFIALALLVCAYLIWAEELPALSMFKQQVIWGATDLTVAKVAVAALAAALTMVAAANIPGLIELVLLHRMNLVKGERYAITTIIRYLIAVIGIVFTFNAIGIDWSKVQWLVAALGVGLGFGLQEILANFISGLIILLEQPIRVGDTVTVGGLTGTVSKIRIRATCITDFDCKELIVPNKEFVTSKVLNWSLNDNLLRLVIPVGVMSGGDPQMAQLLMLRAAEQQCNVLRHPEPKVVITGFGDNVMVMELRAYCRNIDHLVPARNEISAEIAKLFREHKIEYRAPKDTPDFYPAKL